MYNPEQDDDEIKEIIETDAQDEYDLKEASKQLYSYLDDVFENPTTNIEGKILSSCRIYKISH